MVVFGYRCNLNTFWISGIFSKVQRLFFHFLLHGLTTTYTLVDRPLTEHQHGKILQSPHKYNWEVSLRQIKNYSVFNALWNGSRRLRNKFYVPSHQTDFSTASCLIIYNNRMQRILSLTLFAVFWRRKFQIQNDFTNMKKQVEKVDNPVSSVCLRIKVVYFQWKLLNSNVETVVL